MYPTIDDILVQWDKVHSWLFFKWWIVSNEQKMEKASEA